MAARRADVFCSTLWIFFVFVVFTVKNRCFITSDGISITLLKEEIICKENYVCSSLFVTRAHQRYIYKRKMCFLCLLLLMCGDVEKCPGPTDHNLQDLFKHRGLKVFHQNIRGLYQNMAILSTFLYKHKNTHIFSLSETHIDNSTPSQLFEIPGYTFVYKNRDTGTYGGVAAYIKDGIPFIRRTDLENADLECIWLEINFPNTKSFLLSIWYRPPSTSKFLPRNFNELLRTSLMKASSENKETILTGDFNINYRKANDCKELKSVFTLFQFKQVIKFATRVTVNSESIIDLVFTNVPFNITKNDVYALNFSDHDLIGFNRKQNRVKTSPKTVRFRSYKNYDHLKLKQELKNTDWSSGYNANTVSESLKVFNQILLGIFNRYAPYHIKRTNTNICPWLTLEVKNEMDYRDVLQKKFRKSKTTDNYEKYKRQRNKVNNLIKSAKQNYNKNLLKDNIKNSTSFWKSLKKIFPTKSKAKHTDTTFKLNNEDILDKQTIASEFGKFFSDIPTKLMKTLHPFKNFIWNKPKKVPIRTTQNFSFRSVTSDEINKYLKKLQRKKASGIDDLPPNLLKDSADEISKPV